MRWGNDRLDQIREGQARAAADRKRLIERLRARAAQIPIVESPQTISPSAPELRRFGNLNIDDVMVAAGRLRFMLLDATLGQRCSLNRPTLRLLEWFLRTLKSGQSQIVLQWPSGQRDVSLIHPLAMLAMLCAPLARTTRGLSWCDAVPDFRTLYFPWRGGATGAVQRNLLLDRNELLQRNKYHLTRRSVNEPEASDILGRLHETVGHLNRLSVQDGHKPHLAHPTLSEIYPVFVAEGGDLAPSAFAGAIGELFGRVRHGAALDRLTDHRTELSRAASAPFGLFGVSSRADFRKAFAHAALSAGAGRGRPPDVCLLDLGPPALARVGHGWEKTLEHFFTETRSRFSDLPVLAVTQDSYVHRRVGAIMRAAGKEGKGTGAAEASVSSVLVRLSDDPLTNDPVIERVSPIKVQFYSASGAASEALSALSEAARETADAVLAGTLRRGMGGLRRALSVPCGLATAYAVLCEEQGQAAAEAFLEFRSSATLLASIQNALATGIGGPERARLLEAEAAVRRAFDALDTETPIGSLLGEVAVAISRKSSRSLLVFATAIEQRLGERRILGEGGDAGRSFQRRLVSGHVRLTTADDLENQLRVIEASRDRNSWKRLVFIAVLLDQLSVVLSRSWLPEELVVLCDRAFTIRVASVYRQLAVHRDLAGEGHIGGRLSAVASAAREEAAARDVPTVDLELEPRLTFSAGEEVIDLTDDGEDDGRELIVLTLQSGRTLRARPGSVIIRHHRDAEINPFERASAKDIHSGDAIVIPDHSFVEEARRILPVRVLAQNWVEVFHATIEASLAQIPGETLSAKAHSVLAEIQVHGARTKSQGAVLDWLKVEERKGVPRDRLRPHAPQSRREFNAFMAVMNVPRDIAEKIWTEGIEPLRIDRRRAGLRMAQAFVSVLVDPHAAAVGLDPSVRQSIKTLCTKALDHLDEVIAREIYDSREGDVA